ncbi:CHAT domain-containing protein [Amycolatopsis alba DSM 44262]|uniref:CHAT domain-containing protein n=1 Tax=Amycolatopsis alba DSM 44262 TaxID=1125972 RepID=A0A229S0U7_AMYAL|nr:CHAT domain-containing protein [Amycolatopsis alba DSM 44262]
MRVPAPSPPVVDPVAEEAADLHRQARAAASDHGLSRPIRLLRRALALLGPVDAELVARLEIRVRILISLAAAEAEFVSQEDGLARLDEAERIRLLLPGGDVRHELRFVVGLQRAVVLMRAGRLEESLALNNAFLPGLAAEAGKYSAVLTRSLVNRAWLHLEMSNPDAAYRDLVEASDLAVEHGHRLLEGKIRHNLGDHAQLLGDIPEALRHYEQAATIFVTDGPGSLPLVRLDQAKALLTAGLAEEAARHLDDAIPELQGNGAVHLVAEAEVARAGAAILERDYALAKKLAASARRSFLRRGKGRWAEIAALTRLRADAVKVLADRDKKPSAKLPEQLADLAVRLAELGLRDEAGAARMFAVRLLIRRDETAAAQELLAQVPKPRQTTPIDHRMLLRLCRAELAVASHRPRSALAQARAGLVELGQIRDRMGGLDLVCGTAAHGEELGKLALTLVLKKARRSGAGAKSLFAWLERTRAQVYRYEPLPIIEDPALARHINEMRHVQGTIQARRLSGEPVGKLEERYDRLQREATRLGWYTSQWGRPRPVSAPEEVVERLGDRVLVSLMGYRDTLYAVVVDRGRFRLLKLGPLAEIVETARQLHADLDALAPDNLPAPLVEVVTGSARRRADKLDKLISASLAKTLENRELIIVPIGSLYALPWGALPSLHGHPVSIAPSATAWVTASGRRSDGPVLLAGGPGVPGSVGEVRNLRTVYPQARLVDGKDATSDTVLSALDGSGMAHLVAHGAHEPANALFSRLELVGGPLYAHETARLAKPPERVVLAACELAMSHIRPGEEALGFAGTLLASGSRTVIGAIARVGDKAAADAMSDLHRRLASGTAPALALAEATAADPLRRPFLCLGAG